MFLHSQREVPSPVGDGLVELVAFLACHGKVAVKVRNDLAVVGKVAFIPTQSCFCLLQSQSDISRCQGPL